MIDKLIKLNVFAIALAAVVVILGAYTRLTDAGLGCPDWPGCYGFLSVPTEESQILAAEQAFPERPVEIGKAWNEMIHRYFAGTLGLVILALFLLSRKQKVNRVLPALLLVVVTFQALLGMWTVTMNLMPLVVMGHLLGGFTTFCLLVLNYTSLKSRQGNGILSRPSTKCHRLYVYSRIAFVVLVLQIALGGWTAANYAAVVCTELPICEGNWQQKFDVTQALTVPTGHANYEYGVFPYEARMSIHVLHRFGAVCVMLAFIALCWQLMQSASTLFKRYAIRLSVLVTLQFMLGISNVVFTLPIAIAVSHNFVALCLLAVLVCLLFDLSNQNQAQSSFNTWIKG